MERTHRRLPPVGQRIVKSSIGVLLGFLVYYARGCQGVPFYTALSVLWCMRPYTTEAKKMAAQRTIGTCLGGLYGLILILLRRDTPLGQHEFACYVLIALCIIPIIYTTVLLDRKNASYFACVVFLSITVMHMTDSNPYIFVFNRMFDTFIGICIGLVVNLFHMPRYRRPDTLFVSGMDAALLSSENTFSPYSRVELNRMLDDGAQFTISTMRTPATLVENLRDIRLKLPVIAMDGAVLYDIRENRYLKTVPLPHGYTVALVELMDAMHISAFVNVIRNDRWEIYYESLTNEAQSKLCERLRRSPYRNYIPERAPGYLDAVYLLVVETEERIKLLYDRLKEEGWTERCLIKIYSNLDHPGYQSMRICHREATRANMVRELARSIEAEKTVTFSSIPGEADVLIQNPDGNQVVKTLKRLYEPYIWEQ